MSTLLVDIGNTRVKLARFEGARAEPVAIPHRADGFPDALAAALDAELHAQPVGRTALLASVGGPALTSQVQEALARRHVRVRNIAVAREHAGLTLCYADASRFGVDRWLALLGARAVTSEAAPLLVVACGTAVTLDVVTAEGLHRGGRIAPSPELMAEALRTRAPHLPQVAMEPAARGFACDTADAIRSGCLGAAAGLVVRSLTEATALVGARPRLLLTGGGAGALMPLLVAAGVSASQHPWLVLDGLAALASAPGGHVPP